MGLSLLLFIAYLNDVIRTLTNLPGSEAITEFVYRALAFADHLLLLAPNVPQLQRLLDRFFFNVRPVWHYRQYD